jgi:magnesium transporter
MLRITTRAIRSAGQPPGTVVHVGEERTAPVRVRVMRYDERGIEERDLPRAEEGTLRADGPGVTWINIDGTHDTELLERIGARFGLHPLTVEDIADTGQRPKAEAFDEYVQISLKMVSQEEAEGQVEIENMTLILGRNYLLSVQEMEGDFFDPIRERLRKAKGRIRRMGPDYLTYALMDAVVDHYFVVLENLGETLEDLDEELMANPGPATLLGIHALKRELLFLRKSIWPLRDALNTLEHGESDLIREKTVAFLRDVQDHTIQLIDTIETYRDIVSGMLEIYLSRLSQRMNEVMKVLTIIATIFIPLTFIVGVYGMNFRWMPELEWRWGYGMVWTVMLLATALMLFLFRRKRWI